MKFWAVYGSWGFREKKLPTAISMQLFELVFSTFCGQKKNLSVRIEKLHKMAFINLFFEKVEKIHRGLDSIVSLRSLCKIFTLMQILFSLHID